MAKIVADRVLETSITPGSGALTLAGGVPGFRAASTVCANADTFDYYAEDVDANSVPTGGWETGLGTWGTGGILTRTTIYASSNAGAAVVWAAGTRRIGMGLTASKILSLMSTSGGTLTGALNYAATATIASAATTDIGASTSNSIIVTGTTAITSLGTIAAGAERAVTFTGALALTHNAASLILPGAANITTAVGDCAYFISLGAGNWRCTGYQKASGTAVVSAGGSATLTISQKTTDYTIVGTDNGAFINYASGTFTLTLTAAATLGAGFNVRINNQGTGTITLAANGTNNIAGSTQSLLLSPGTGYFILTDGTNFFVESSSPFGPGGVQSAQTGYGANGGSSGAAFGYSANGNTDGAAVGQNSNGNTSGAAIGGGANGSNLGVAVGRNSNGTNNGVGIGYYGNGQNNGVAIGYGANTNNKDKAVALGFQSLAQRYREMVRNADGANPSKQSWSVVNWYGDTADATVTELLLGGTATQRCILLANSAFEFEMQICAGVTGGGNTSGWKISGCIKQGATAASTVLVGTPTVTITGQDAGASTWAVAVAADATNGALKLTVTGQAATTIRWNAHATLSELRF